MKKITFFLLIFVLAYAKTYSQKEAYNWNFGIGAALTFNTSDIEPVFVPNSKLSNWEGCTTMSDENGNLLFYSNGSSIWNKENNIMDNGSGLHGNNSATHSCVSFKKPGSTNQYYIFTVDAVESQRFGFNYSIIDISLNGGLGKVIQKNINVHPKPVEKLLVIPHSNQIDYWVIVHLWENNEYLAYLVDNNGVNSTPVVSHGTILSPRSTGHAIKASQDGKKIASAHSFAKVIELYDFDATTGKMTLTHNLQHEYFDWPYGVEFSPDKTRLYASLFSPCRLVQLDLTQNSENAIVNSMVELGYHKTATFYYGSLQMAPNGKMYVAKDGTTTLGVIKKPNELGFDCEYLDIGFNLLNGSKSGLGLPTFVQTFINPQIFCIPKGEELIPNGSFDNDFDGFYSQYYFIKNPPMGMNGAFTITNDPSAYFSGWMKFDDKSPSSNGNMFLADAGSNTKAVLIGTNVPVKKNTYYQFSCWVASVHNVVPPLIKVLINDQFQIAKQVPAKGGEWVNILFEWNSSNFDNAKVELFDDNPSLFGNDFVIDEISLKECFPENPKFKISSNRPVCEDDDLLLFADNVANAQYHWFGPNGFTSSQQNPVIKNTKQIHSGKYSCYYTIGTYTSDTVTIDIVVNQKSSFTIKIKDKKRLCPGDSAVLIISDCINCTYLWAPNGEKSDRIKVKKEGKYSVKVTNQFGCSNTDSVEITIIKPLKLQSDSCIDFGDLDPCQSEKSDSILIANIGTEETIIVSIFSINNEFLVESPLPIIVLPIGSSVYFKVKFSPQNFGKYLSDIKLISECGDIYSFCVKGSKLKSLVNIDKQSINFGNRCFMNDLTVDTVINISNNGTVDAVIQKPDIIQPFTIVSPNFPLTLKSDESIKVTIRYSPVIEGLFNSVVKFPFKSGSCPYDTLSIDLQSLSYESKLSTQNQFILMPDMCECDISKDTIITIINSGSVTDTIYKIESDINSTFISPLPLPVIINPGDSIKITLRWNPVAIDSVTSFINLHYQPCDKILPLIMTGRKNDLGFFPYDTLNFGEFIMCSDSALRKDLIVKNKNCSQETARITDAFVNSQIFRADIPQNDLLPFNGTKTYNISFLPKSLADTMAILEIHYMPCKITRKIVLKGSVVQPELSISDIDFGEIFQYQYDVKEVTLSNNGTTTDTITKLNGINPPLSLEPPTPQYPIILKPGEFFKVKIRYSPITRGFDTISISADYLPCNLNSKAKVMGNSGLYAKTVVCIDSSKANTGDTTTLHLILRHSENMRQSGITGYKAQFRYNATLLFPTFYVDNDSIFDNERIMQISNTLPDNFPNDNFILKEMKFVAALGNSECTLMKLDTVIWLGGPYDIIKEDGKFCLKNVCYEGGPRLINPNNKVELLQISPNPNDGNLAVELNLIEEGLSTLSIYNSDGQLMFEQSINGSTGKIELNIDTKEYGNGLYFVSLQTPTIRKVKQMVVFK